ncbi:MAG TPA: hypothetical protein VJ260_00555, partial [Vicinamibacterales bacterium]|nr:hypothetical protein [Vicinamibacterales bacterium]
MNVNNTIHRTVLAAVIGATLALGVGAPAFAREPTAAQEQQHKHDKKQRDEARQQAQQHERKAQADVAMQRRAEASREQAGRRAEQVRQNAQAQQRADQVRQNAQAQQR